MPSGEVLVRCLRDTPGDDLRLDRHPNTTLGQPSLLALGPFSPHRLGVDVQSPKGHF